MDGIEVNIVLVVEVDTPFETGEAGLDMMNTNVAHGNIIDTHIQSSRVQI